MKLLAIDTSGDACSAALLRDDSIAQHLETQPRRHGELILAMMDSLLREADLRPAQLDAMAFGRGPGSFTGVRIAAAVTQGAAFGADLPVVPVSTLAAMAQGEHRRTGRRRILPALDARMEEVYWGCYLIRDDGLAHPCGEERVCPPTHVEIPAGDGWQGVGPGWSTYEAALKDRLDDRLGGMSPDAICEARDIAFLAAAEYHAGRRLPPEQAIPAYLRDRVTRAG